MGHAIFYCHQCSTRVREEDIAHRKAFMVGDRVVCAACAPESLKAAKPPPPPTARKTVESTAKMARISAAAAPKSAAAGNPALLLGAIGGGVAIVAVLLAFALGGSAPKGEVVETRPVEETGHRIKPPPPPPPPPPASAGRDAEAQKALSAARDFARANPTDLKGQLREFDRLGFDHGGTPAAEEAKKEAELIRAKQRESIGPAMAALEAEIKPLLEREQFGEARKILDDAKPRFDFPEASLALSRRRETLMNAVQSLLEELKAKAVDAQARKSTAEVEKIRERLSGWGLQFPAKELDEALGARAPPPPAPTERVRSEEGKAYLQRWEQAAAKATDRRYPAALAEIEGSRASLKEADTKAELDEDLRDLRSVEALCRIALEAATKKSAGQRLHLRTIDGKQVSGRVLSIDADRVEIQGDPQKPTDFVEWNDAAPGSLLALTVESKPDPRTQALFCLLEGDVDGAKSALGRIDGLVPDKYWSYAETAKSRRSKAEPAESAARELYYGAERQYRSMETRGPAIEKYRQLKSDYAGTELVKKLSVRIAARSEPLKEYYYSAADLRSSGTLKLNKNGKLESKGDSDGPAVLQNYAELGFYAFPGASYKCWIQAGGCCVEVMTFYVQATDLMDLNPKTKQREAITPGGGLVTTIKPVIRGLKPTHAPNEPKTAARWEWIEIPLPKYAAPGLKVVRVLTDKGGFSIGAAIVSSSKSKAPSDAEAKEFETKRAEEKPVELPDPDLIAYWKFDEGSGATTEDASGNGHTATLKSGAEWAQGKFGGGIRFNGDASYVAAPNSPDLDKVQEGDYTLAAWFNPENVPPGRGTANDACYGILIKAGYHTGLHYNYNQVFQVDHWTTEKNCAAGSWSQAFPPGAFYQVTSVVSRTEGSTKIYVNGKLVGSGQWTAGTAAKGYGAQTWKIGVGGPTQTTYRWGAKGIIDEVRIYRRALAADEVQSLYDQGK